MGFSCQERSAEAEPTKATQKKPEEEEEAKQAEARDSAEGGEEEDGQAAEEQGGEEREAEEGESQEDKERQQKATAEDEDSAGQDIVIHCSGGRTACSNRQSGDCFERSARQVSADMHTRQPPWCLACVCLVASSMLAD